MFTCLKHALVHGNLSLLANVSTCNNTDNENCVLLNTFVGTAVLLNHEFHISACTTCKINVVHEMQCY